ncbi:GTP cyclohydrolase IB [Myxococcaceae bacterium]|jgi:GTP cyclohydrolase I|nr:GTP cyclohydrolase IB [Myxococcaceae bacterium]
MSTLEAHPLLRAGRPLPDVTHEHAPKARGRLDRVGMEGIDVPVRVRDADARPMIVPGRCDVFVSLDDAEAKGIHMSRLFLLLQQTLVKEELCPATLETLLHGLVQSHAATSRSAFVRVRFDYLLEQPALVSDHVGWKSHPVTLSARLEEGRFSAELEVDVPYSSTCPCSAALARELIRARFLEAFEGDAPLRAAAVADWLATEEGVSATPHSQRSHAEVRVRLGSQIDGTPFSWLIATIEKALGTPVQAAVKREDEQAFADLNGKNLMFCEDAARKIRSALERDSRVVDYHVRVRHEESLHPHDAVAVVVKGVAGGYAA